MKTYNTIAQIPGALPFLGHAPTLLRDPFTFLKSLSSRDGLATVRVGPVNVIIVCDPDLTHEVLVDDRTYDKGGPILERFNEPLGDGLGSCPHSRHRRQRRMIQPVFHTSRMHRYGDDMVTQINNMVGNWRDGTDLVVNSQMMTLAVRIAIATMFSDSLPPGDAQDATEDLRTVDEGMYRRAMLPKKYSPLPTPANRKYFRALARIRRTIDQVVADRERENIDHGDLLSALMAARDAGEGLTRAEIVDQAMTFFLGGTVAYSSTMSWSQYLVATHPEVERRLFEEVDAVLGNRPATFEDLPNLRYTRQVISETLRVHPPGWLLSRMTTAETTLGGHTLPAGTSVFYSPLLIQHRSDLYPDPSRFDPDRWETETPTSRREAFIAFSAGARKCIGEEFGYVESVLALATIASRWRMQVRNDGPVRPAKAIVAVPRKLVMRPARRQQRLVQPRRSPQGEQLSCPVDHQELPGGAR